MREVGIIGACVEGDAGRVRAMLEADPEQSHARDDFIESTPLHFASHRGYTEIVRLLLDAGGDVAAREGCSDTTPLHWAAEGGHAEVARLLLEHGADLEARDGWYDLTPLGWATVVDWAPQFRADRPQVIRLLLERGARIELFSAVAMENADEVSRLAAEDSSILERRLGFADRGQVALHLAVKRAIRGIVEILLGSGADPSAVDDWGVSALGLALRAGDEVMSPRRRGTWSWFASSWTAAPIPERAMPCSARHRSSGQSTGASGRWPSSWRRPASRGQRKRGQTPGV